ncbi:hypothetical protein [Enterococcus villorum]|uniref:ATP synthase F0, A subunit n=2 Tax=Enterococcus villorum TaxID=112904 RepID=A0A511IYV1_9ENTE|nr:hypothetical protein [Enterococcus villorum]EOH87496.1 hypothetical protein UAO_02207 [Enterococcus villorum ATCC 700913]EOW77785.1 hypothetical protein I591_00639 [Enterococcus villorum ATCC 700913]GEL90960.1 ATP synthase F0, A subunit [Enterococcus villorum]
MKYLIDSYDAYMTGGGLLDKGWQAVNWFFVGVPFFILKLCVSFFLFCESVLNQSDFFIGKQTETYEMSVKILKNFGGTSFGSGTLMGLAVMFSAYYLLANFFSNKRNFSKALLHYIVVVLLFFGWFGQIQTNQGTYNVPTFFIQSVHAVTKTIQQQFIAGNDTSKESQSTMFDVTVKQTFNYVNSGSLDGTMANGEKLEESKLLQVPGLSESEKAKFKKEREQYIDTLEKENPYFVQDGSKTMEKSFAIWIGVINLVVLAIPPLYINILLTIMQMAVNLLILIFPIIAFASFFPKCQMVMFKFFKGLLGILFMPVVYSVFLSVLYWMNQLVDQVFLNVADTVNQSLLNVLSGGIVLLGTRIIMIVVKIIMIKTVWKNRYRLLRFFSDGQIQQPIFEKQVNEKVKEGATRIGEIGVGTAQVAAGAYTGNLGMALNGATTLLPDKALNLGREHFVDENGQFAGVKQGVQSLFKKGENEEVAPSTFQENQLKDTIEPLENKEIISEEPLNDKAMEDVFTEMDAHNSEVERSLDETDHLNFEALEQEIPPEPELAVDTDTLATIERNEEEGNNEKEETNEPHSPEMMDNLNVTVDNFDELTFEQEEKAYFDHKEDQELLVNYEPPMNERNQEALTIKNLEGEDTFFDAWQERSIDEQGEVW